MRTVDLRSDTSRYVLFLENPTKVFEGRLDGSIQQRVRTQVDQFLTEATPESALQSIQKFPGPLRQLKDRGGQARALGTWCKGEEFDLFVVQILYHKSDESSYLPKKHVFAERGKDLENRFEAMEHDELQVKVDEWARRNDVRVFTDQ